MKCPICGRSIAPPEKNQTFPFCSERCKMIDGKRWLNEEYSFTTINTEKLEEEIAELEQQIVVDAEKN